MQMSSVADICNADKGREDSVHIMNGSRRDSVHSVNCLQIVP